MSDSKTSIEAKILNDTLSFDELMKEIQCMQILSPIKKSDHVNKLSGYLNTHMQIALNKVSQKIYNEMNNELIIPLSPGGHYLHHHQTFNQSHLLPAASFAVTGLGNPESLSSYAYYRLLISLTLDSEDDINKLPVYVYFKESSVTSTHFSNDCHQNIACNLTFDKNLFKEKQLLKVTSNDQAIYFDACLESFGVSKLLLSKINKLDAKAQLPVFINLLEGLNLKEIKEFQAKIKHDFPILCARYKKELDDTLNTFNLLELNNEKSKHSKIGSVEINGKNYNNCSFIDFHSAKSYLKTIYAQRDNPLGKRLRVIDNIEFLWDYMIRRSAELVNILPFFLEEHPSILKIMQKHFPFFEPKIVDEKIKDKTELDKSKPPLLLSQELKDNKPAPITSSINLITGIKAKKKKKKNKKKK